MELNNMDKESKLRLYPSDNPNFTPGLEAEFFSAVGQDFIQCSDQVSERVKKFPVTFQVKVKINHPSHAKRVKDVVKGLYALFKTQTDLIEEFEMEDLIPELQLDLENDDDYVYILFGLSQEKIEWLVLEWFDFFDEEENPGINFLAGKTWLKGTVELIPIRFLTDKLTDFFKTFFSFSVSGYSNRQGSAICKFFFEDDMKERIEKDDYGDLLEKYIERPIEKFMMKYKEDSEPFEFDTGYNSQEFGDKVKKIFTEENDDEASSDGPNNEFDEMSLELINFQNDFVKSSIEFIQEFNKGFYKPYFEIIDFIDFNQFSLTLCLKDKVAFANLDIKTQGISEFLVDKLSK